MPAVPVAGSGTVRPARRARARRSDGLDPGATAANPAATVDSPGTQRTAHSPLQHADGPKPYSFVALSAHASQVQAKVTLTDAKERTKLRVVCHGKYDSTGGYPTTSAPSSGLALDTGNYHVIVINRAGVRFDGGGWTPGGDVIYSTSAPWPERAISKIQIVDAQGVALLQVVL
jgi:hypothetical protein